MSRPKPSITVDERGAVLHMTDSEGNGIAVPLEPETVATVVQIGKAAAAKLATPEGREFVKSTLLTLWKGLTK